MTRTHPDVIDLPSAIGWLQKAWMTLPVPPARLHSREVDGQLGPSFTPAFARILSGSAYDTEVIHETDTCHHPRLIGHDVRTCPDCSGDGVHEVTRERYRSPMAAALVRLSKMPRPSDGTPSPAEFILTLYGAGWDWRFAAIALGLIPVSKDHEETVKAQFLLAIRQLRQRFADGPIGRVSYVDKSDAQRSAEDAA